jgi:hypothetical protein
MRLKSCPASSADMISTVPEGVSIRVVVSRIFESLNAWVYSSAASRASLSNHKNGLILCIWVAPSAFADRRRRRRAPRRASNASVPQEVPREDGPTEATSDGVEASR